MKKSKDKVIRIRPETYKKLRELGNMTEPKLSINETLEHVIAAAEKVIGADMVYATELYTDIAVARGQAILQSIKKNDVPTPPKVVIIVGEDNFK